MLALFTSPATGQFPIISARQYTAGSVKLTVRGSVQIDQEVPINVPASYSDGEVTWLQFGVSGSAEPNVLITYGETKEIGVTIGKEKFVATGGIVPGEPSQCTGKTDVAKALVSGHYSCKGIASHDGATGAMGKVDIEVHFSAKT
ncbi:MAG TPA: hypothetical protein VFM14_16900 [Gemmatimonadales bacterium]|nr:hypothetical protein [Gemmatimonadales bacterium]